MVTRMNANVTKRIAEAQGPPDLPPFARARSRFFQLNPNCSVIRRHSAAGNGTAFAPRPNSRGDRGDGRRTLPPT